MRSYKSASRKTNARLRAVRKRLNDRSLSRPIGVKPIKRTSYLAIAGAVFLGLVSYLTAADKIDALLEKWSESARQNIMALAIKHFGYGKVFADDLIDANFKGNACDTFVLPADLDRDGLETDLLVKVSSKRYSPNCTDDIRPTLIILKSNGWSWQAAEMIASDSNDSKFRVKNGYIFQAVNRSRSPNFKIFGWTKLGVKLIHEDHGELPNDLCENFLGTSETEFALSGRSGDFVVSFDRENSQYTKFERKSIAREWSKLNAITTSGTDYFFNGDKVVIDNLPNISNHDLEDLDLLYIPSHCVSYGFRKASGFPNFFAPKDTNVGPTNYRVCCPTDFEDFASCTGSKFEIEFRFPNLESPLLKNPGLSKEIDGPG